MSTAPNSISHPLLVLNQAALDRVDYTLGEVLETVEKSIAGLRVADSLNPLKIVMEGSDKQSLSYAMTGRDGTWNTVGFKFVYEFDPDRTRDAYQFYSFLFVCDDATGTPIALMDVVLLGPLRTSATSALLARQAATSQARVALVVGTGAQGRMALPMLATAMPQLERLIVHGRHTQGLREVAATLRRYHADRDVEISNDLQRSAEAADIVIGVAGSASKEAVHRRWLKPGAVAVLVGYGIDADVLQGADYVLATDEAQMRVTSGDLADEKGRLPPVNAELPDILLGRKAARANADDVIFAYNSGLVVTDVAVGRMLAERARQQGLGQEMPLW